jgi:hypothetical protein
MKIYIITCNDKVSSEGYDSYEKAWRFINNRIDKPSEITKFYFQSCKNIYKIHDIDVK